MRMGNVLVAAAQRQRHAVLGHATSSSLAAARNTTTTLACSNRFLSTQPLRPDDDNDEKSMTESVSDWLVSMRWKAAEALTSSLTKQEQEALLNRLDPSSGALQQQTTKDTQDKDDDELQHSIAEAVAKARAQESQRLSATWEREKVEIAQQAEQAARKRLESDLQLQQHRQAQFQKWQQQVVEQKQQELKTTPTAEPEVVAEVADSQQPSDQQSQEQAETPTNETAKAEENAQHHPILGPCVLDLGYKQMYCVSYEKLIHIPVWKKQRIYRHERATLMAKDKKATMHLGLPGIIGLHQSHDNGQLYILDGQHRVGMFGILAAQQNNDKNNKAWLQNILVEVYPEPPEHPNHAQELFLEVNKAEPVKLVDMPGVAKSSDRKLLTEAAQHLADHFPSMFSASQKCRVPHLNLDNLRDALFAARVLPKHKIKTTTALVEWLLEQNEVLQKKYQTDAEAQALVSATALKKAHKFEFYLGLDSSWYNN